jgi:hypothetical protein
MAHDMTEWVITSAARSAPEAVTAQRQEVAIFADIFPKNRVLPATWEPNRVPRSNSRSSW